MTPDVPGPFPADALDANRNGFLADAQRLSHTATERGGRGHDLFVAAFFVLAAVIVLRANGPAANAWIRPLAAVGALIAAGVLVLRPKGLARRRVERDLKAGRVESVEGAISKDSFYAGSARAGTRYYRLEVGGRTLKVGADGYEAAPDAGYVRAYFLPTSGWVVNLEHLPDRLPPREAVQTPAALLKTLGTAFGLHGGEAAAEARAGLAGLMNALAPERALETTPPPLLERDPRPLDQAILGSWHSGAMRLTFSGDGTVTLTGLAGMERQGRWSVDAAGRLHSDALGPDEAAEAWVSADALTIAAAEGALKFRRM